MSARLSPVHLSLLPVLISMALFAQQSFADSATQYLQTTSRSVNKTNLHIINTAIKAQTFTGTLYNGEGERLGNVGTSLGSTVAPGARLILDSDRLESLFQVEAWSGPAMLEVSGDSSFELMAKLVNPGGLVSNTNCVRENRVLNLEGFDTAVPTYVRFINTTDSVMSSIRGTLYNPDGSLVGTTSTILLESLAPKAQVWINRDQLAELFGSQWNGIAMLEVEAQNGLKLLNLNFINNETFFNFSCFENSTLGTVYLQTTSKSNNVSYTHIVNTAVQPQQFRGTLYDGDGKQLGLNALPLHSGTIPAKGRLILSSTDLENIFQSSPWTGPAMLVISGDSTFEQMTRLTSPSGLISNTNCVRRREVHNVEGVDSPHVTYVRFINASDRAINEVRGTLYDASGGKIGGEDSILVPGLAARQAVWRSRDELSALIGSTWQGEASLIINNAENALRLLNLNFINSETFFNFSCYQASVPTINSAPVFSSASGASMTENISDTGYQASATDADNNELLFRISGDGADDALFTIDATSGELSFISAPDFESPSDADKDNIYQVTLNVTDGGTTTGQTVTITVNASEVSITETLGLTDIALREPNLKVTADFHTPDAMVDRLIDKLTVDWTPASSQPEDRMKFSFGPSATSNVVLVVDSPDTATISEKLLLADLTTSTSISADTALRSMFELVQMENGSYAIFSIKHPNYALDANDNTTELVLRDVRSLAAFNSVNTGLLTFSLNAGNTTLVADGRFSINKTASGAPSKDETGTLVYEADASWQSRVVSIDGNGLGLAGSGGTVLTLYKPLLNLAIPFDFNPEQIERVSNAEYYPGFSNENLFAGGIDKIDAAYAAQVSAPGVDASTLTAVNSMLDEIETSLASQGSQMRYPREFYLALRDGMLRRRLQSLEALDGELNQLTIPYVYFTNEKDDKGDYHPFMVIATHGVPDTLALLGDVNRPPGDGLGSIGYDAQNVTRSFYIENFLLKIPVRDYGETATLEENILDLSTTGIGSLAEDEGESSHDHHNYASRGASAVSVDGVVIYPAYNNRLSFAQEAGELSVRGMHSGRGLGVHYHADGHGAAVASGTTNDLNFYDDGDYLYHRHPPIVSIGFDGVAGYGYYMKGDTRSDGVDVALDSFGGHEHGHYGYHYHSASTDNVTSARERVTYSTHELGPLGAWSGRINLIPEFTVTNRSRYHGNE